MQKNILVAPLNWGLGHASRCIPIIRALQQEGYRPILASDGVALALLEKEFPHLQTICLPSYDITYAKKGKYFKLKLLWDSPKIIDAIKAEKKAVKKIMKQYAIAGIISDNRLGVRSKKVPSVFITHQLNVLTGNTTWMSSKVHQRIAKKFDAIWVPDVSGKPNLSGKLGHLKKKKMPLQYIGPISRLEKRDLDFQYDLMVILSGPEPQRAMLEEKLLLELQGYKGKVLFVKGKIEDSQQIEERGRFVLYNYMDSSQLEIAFNSSLQVLSRSGYTTVLDLAKLGKKAFFIPTPGQYEQEYLAKRLQKLGLVPMATQEAFVLSDLDRVKEFEGLNSFDIDLNFGSLFALFEGE
ncbi:MAG: glycosyltransferase [Flavobacteriaceae bacterium]|nr:glycosyltransferase [Flavobacteriaceae bacterium]